MRERRTIAVVVTGKKSLGTIEMEKAAFFLDEPHLELPFDAATTCTSHRRLFSN